jgi:hypothetical protein
VPVAFCCGDGVCDSGEDSCSCTNDCGSAPVDEAGSCNDGEDNDCDGAADCDDADCSADPVCQVSCGDGTCSAGEDCESCSLDCAGNLGGKPSRRFCCGDGSAQGAEGDGSLCDGNF